MRSDAPENVPDRRGWTKSSHAMAGTDQVRHYGYDDIDRLTAVTELDSSLESGLESFSYDGNGNRLTYQQIVDQDTNSTAYSYRSTGNILESLSSNTGNRNFGWDDNGNMVSDSRLGTLSHLYYDVFNQLEEVRWTDLIGDDYIKFGYNVDGERVYKEYKYYYRDICDGHEWLPPDGLMVDGNDSLGVTTLSSGTLPPDDTLCIFSKTTYTRYVVSKGKVLAEYSGSGGTSREFAFIYAGNQRIAMIDSEGKLHFYLNDHLGSARIVIDTAGTVKDSYDYYAFGEALDQTISTGQSYGYTGKPFDNDHSLNLHYSGARYYDGTTGRFISVDPKAGKYPSFSPYTYVADNPLKFIDPDGRYIEAPASDRPTVTKMINSRARGVFKFDDKTGKLQVVTTKGSKGYSKYYRDRLIQAINDPNHKITVRIGQTYQNNGKTQDVDVRAGGGVTLSEGWGKNQEVVISGNENKTLKDTNGKPLTDKAEDVLAHELVGHAIPRTVGSDTGNAVDNENKVREQLKDDRKRAAEPKHGE